MWFHTREVGHIRHVVSFPHMVDIVKSHNGGAISQPPL